MRFEKCTNQLDNPNVKIPVRKTKFSAGYDFVSPETYVIEPGQTVKIPTGIKVSLKAYTYLALYVRSSLGIKKNLILPNCVGIIDADYYNNPDNEGEIIGALTNLGTEPVNVNQGDAFMQGIITRYETVDDDSAVGFRTGGIGSTGN